MFYHSNFAAYSLFIHSGTGTATKDDDASVSFQLTDVDTSLPVQLLSKQILRI